MTVAPGRSATIFHSRESDKLRVTLEEGRAVYETVDPALKIKAAEGDRLRLVGFAVLPYPPLFRRLGAGALSFGGIGPSWTTCSS